MPLPVAEYLLRFQTLNFEKLEMVQSKKDSKSPFSLDGMNMISQFMF
jgi:hypothetical protein